jgi:hypothetical protein
MVRMFFEKTYYPHLEKKNHNAKDMKFGNFKIQRMFLIFKFSRVLPPPVNGE